MKMISRDDFMDGERVEFVTPERYKEILEEQDGTAKIA